MYVKRQSGGLSYQLLVRAFDSWTNTSGVALATVTIPLVDMPTAPEGGWISVQLAAPVSITDPDVYGVSVDKDSNGFPHSYNEHGYAEGDSIVGRRLAEPTFNRVIEMMVRLKGG
jgi:hypothetical protein